MKLSALHHSIGAHFEEIVKTLSIFYTTQNALLLYGTIGIYWGIHKSNTPQYVLLTFQGWAVRKSATYERIINFVRDLKEHHIVIFLSYF